jgi:hypothetical protein
MVPAPDPRVAPTAPPPNGPARSYEGLGRSPWARETVRAALSNWSELNLRTLAYERIARLALCYHCT